MIISPSASVTISLTPEPADMPTVHSPGTSIQTPTLPVKTYDNLGIKVTWYRDEYAGFTLDYSDRWVTDLPDESIKAIYSAYPAFFSQASSAERREPSADPAIAIISVVVFNQALLTFEEAVADFKDYMASSDTTRTV